MEATSAFECSLCFEEYDEVNHCPRLLSCGHTFCCLCLQKILKNGCIECPQDRKSIFVAEGVHVLPKNFSLLDVISSKSMKAGNLCGSLCGVCHDEQHSAEWYCYDCKQAMCQVVAKTHCKLQACMNHTVVSLTDGINNHPSASALCEEHNQSYRYFDNECQRLICIDCFALSHSNHKCSSLNDAAASIKAEVLALCDEAEKNASKIRAANERVANVFECLRHHHNEAIQRLEDDFAQISKQLQSRKETLLSELGLHYKQKSDVLCEQIERLETIQTVILSSVAHARRVIQSSEIIVLLNRYGEVRKALQLKDSAAIEELPGTDNILEYSAESQGLLDRIESFGSVLSSRFVKADDFFAAGPGLTYALVGIEGRFSIKLLEKRSHLYPSCKLPFVVEVQGKNKSTILGKVEAITDGSYHATYAGLSEPSDRIVSVMLEQSHIRGSPFVVLSFFEKLANLEFRGLCLSKTTPNGWDAVARSISLGGTGILRIFVHVEECCSDRSGLTVSFQDEQTSVNDLKNTSNGRGGVVWCNPSRSRETIECFVDFNVNSCGFGGKTGTWRGFVKLCVYLYFKGDQFWVDL